MKILLTGGGTCGHIMPNIALLPYLKKRFDTIYYMGEKDSAEERIAKQYNLPFYYTTAIKLERKKIYKNLLIPFVLTSSVNQAKEILKMLKPDVVLSKGGYASLPTALACKSLHINLVIHESDFTLGIANKICVKRAIKVITSSQDTHQNDNKFICLGNPIRDEIIKSKPLKIDSNLNFTPTLPTILVVGGSSGAKAINDIILNDLPKLTAKYNVLHITGKNCGNTPICKNYHSTAFANNIGEFYQSADLIVSRAGANAVTEISALGKRVIYIPLPKGTSRGDQVDNAITSGNMTIEQETLNIDLLITKIDQLLKLPQPKSNYNIDTAKNIADILYSVANITK